MTTVLDCPQAAKVVELGRGAPRIGVFPRTNVMNSQSPKEEFEIFPQHEAFYISSLLFCTESALASATWIVDLLKKHKNRRYDFPPQPALDCLQNIALQGAGISRFFWPSDPRYRRRGEVLRQAFGITEHSPLRSRDLRNRMEHFDEYLDDYLKDCVAGQFVPDYFGPKPPDDRGPLRFFRAFFTNTGEFEILGTIFAVQPLLDEIGRLHNVLGECDKTGSRFPNNRI